MKSKVTVLVAGLAMAAGLAACGEQSTPAPPGGLVPTESPSASTSAPMAKGVPGGAQRVTIVKIVDGDTVVVSAASSSSPLDSTSPTTVRLLEIDTPETKHPTIGVECYGPEASVKTGNLLPVGSTAWVTRDKQLKDRYDRHLLYIWNESGTFVNLELVRLGYAEAKLYKPNDKYIDEMNSAEADARSEKLGMWEKCAAPVAPKKTTAAPPPPVEQPTAEEPTEEPAAGTDPRFRTCGDANDSGYGPYRRGVDEEYSWYQDRDGDGLVCER